jgi:hypothetical protein
MDTLASERDGRVRSFYNWPCKRRAVISLFRVSRGYVASRRDEAYAMGPAGRTRETGTLLCP